MITGWIGTDDRHEASRLQTLVEDLHFMVLLINVLSFSSLLFHIKLHHL
jgi:hypothetical protein